MSSRRVHTAPRAADRRTVREQPRRGGPGTRRRNPLVLLAVAAGTIVVLTAILVFALVRSANVATSPPTPVPPPGATAGTGPVAMPQPDIGALDRASGSAQPATAAPKPGQPAPDFTWYTTNGRTTLSAMRGHAVLLEFFGVWCGGCQGAVPLLNNLQATYRTRGLQVLAVTGSPYDINHEKNGSEATVGMTDMLQYQQTYHATYQMVLDPTTRVFNMYGRGTTFPTYYVIDGKGMVRWSTSLGVSDQELQAQVAAAL